jgi:hypothetical protein
MAYHIIPTYIYRPCIIVRIDLHCTIEHYLTMPPHMLHLCYYYLILPAC